MSDEQQTVPYSDIVAGFTTEGVDEGDTVLSIFGLVKLRDDEGDVQWAARSGGEDLSSEELLGALIGVVDSMRRDLANDWEW
jgi:hypothetical protein